ncbi:MAG: SDR family NAD(P)-dependent oxidoreductase [Pseudomonadota bacterium]
MATVLITGANLGIGLELAKAYAGQGDTVIATARRPEEAEALKATGAEVHALDVASDDSVAAFAAAIEGRAVNLLTNNAGVGDRTGLGQLDFDQFAHVMNVNTLGPLRVIQALQGNVAAGAGKKIANISSQLGSIENTTGDMGGEQAPVQPADSAAGLVKVIAANGTPGELPFLDWQGERLPW